MTLVILITCNILSYAVVIILAVDYPYRKFYILDRLF